jgi:hypothetical protein
VNHQGRTDEAWYKATIESLGKTSLIPKDFEGEKRELLLSTLIAEILSVVCISVMTNTMFMILGKKVPDLPKLPEDAPKPTFQDVTVNGFLKKGKGTYKNNKVTCAPYILGKDVDRKDGSLFSSMDKRSQEFLLASLSDMNPFIGLSLAPHGFAMLGKMTDDISLTNAEIQAAWKKLDAASYCLGDGFTRADYETLHVALAESYSNAF